MPILTLEQIRDARDLNEELVPVPEWGGEVRVRGMSAADGVGIFAKIKAGGEVDTERVMMYAVLVGVVEPRFSESDLDWLKAKSFAPLKRITEVFMRLSGLAESASPKKD